MKSSEGPLRAADPDSSKTLVGAQLFNLSEDIGEQRDLAAAHPEKLRELATAWLNWNRQLAPPLWGPVADRGRGPVPR